MIFSNEAVRKQNVKYAFNLPTQRQKLEQYEMSEIIGKITSQYLFKIIFNSTKNDKF